MKLIEPSYQILDQPAGLDGIYQQIEMAGRTCYRSQRPEGQTAKNFVDRMIASKHYAMLEHGTVYLKVPVYNANCVDFPHGELDCVTHSPYSKISYGPAQELEGLMDWTSREISTECMYITTNYRVLVENDALCLLEYLCEPTEYHERRVTVRFTTDRGVSHEFVRHRVFSFAQESTRYCNYSKDKFGNELTFIAPSWLNEYYYDGNTYTRIFLDSLKAAESNYLDLLKKWEEKIPDSRYKTGFRNNPWTPQQARQVLPNALKTELVMTGFVSDWNHFFRLRTSIIAETGKPHPDASALADPLYKEFLSRGYIESLV